MKIEDAVQPVRDLMLVRREPGNDKEWKGLHLPESVRKSSDIMGVILRSGPDAEYEPGTRVVMSRNSGTTVALLEGDREELALITALDVLALMPDEEVAA